VTDARTLAIVHTPRFADHVTPPGHPESVERAHVFDAVAGRWRKGGGLVLAPRSATREELTRVHDAAYLDRLESRRGQAVVLDPDTFTSADTIEVAMLAAGAALVGLEHALAGQGPALGLVRPPGHHAERDRAMGFCLYNNTAVAAAAALARGLARVAVVDMDVHHGNGTQWIFYEDPRVLYVSTHQYPYYPGTGAADEAGRGAGAGFTVNLPLAAGAGDADYQRCFEAVIEPVLAAFEPQLVVASCGFDVHERDPLAGMRVSTEGCTMMVTRLRALAERLCGGRLLALTEGGYDLRALGECLDRSVDALAGSAPAPRFEGDTSRADASVRAARAALSAYWPTL
jgi:acetoin utilization deacetylase AcuC-like enzyme